MLSCGTFWLTNPGVGYYLLTLYCTQTEWPPYSHYVIYMRAEKCKHAATL